jgi:hypothetical protein
LRNIIVSLVLFVLLIISITFSIKYLDTTSKSLLQLDNKIEASINSRSWDKAYGYTLEFKDEWDKSSKYISIFTSHAEIDNVYNELWRLTQYTKLKKDGDSLASVHVIKYSLQHIVNMEQISIQNLF